MSELSPTPNKQDVDGKKPQKASLGELLRVDVDKGPTLLSSRRDERELEPAPVKSEGAQPDTNAPETSEQKDASTTGAATPETAAEIDATARASRGASPAATPPAARSPRAASPGSWGLLSRFGWQALGLGFAGAGLLIVPARDFSPRIAELIGRVGDVRVLAGGLFVGGLLISGAGMLRRVLRDIRGSLDLVRKETARLETIAEDNRSVLETLKTIRTDNASLTENVGKLQSRLQRLTDLVSSPDYTVSIFRLAASVDQLGKHVAAYMKEQFGLVQQQLSARALHAERSEQKLGAALAGLQTLAKDHHRSHALAMREAFEELRENSEQTFSRIDQNLQSAARIEAQILTQEQALSLGFTTLNKRSDSNVQQVSSSLDELRARLDRNLADQASSLRATFEQLDQHIEQAESAHVSEVKLQGENLERQLASHVADLQESLDAIAELTNRSGENVAHEFDALRQGLDERARQQQNSLEHVGEEATAAARVAKLELQAKIEQLQDCLEQQAQATLEQSREQQRNSLALLRDQSSEMTLAAKREIAARLEQLKACLEQLSQSSLEQSQGQQTSLEKLRDQSSAATLAAKLELCSRLEQLHADLGQQAREQLTALHRNVQETQHHGDATRRELAASLAEIQTHFEQLSAGQLAAVNKASHDVQASTGTTRRELAISLEQAAARVEQALATRSSELANEMLGIAGLLESVSTELRACTSESIRAVTTSKPAADPIEIAIATPLGESADSTPQAESPASAASPCAPSDESTSTPRNPEVSPDFS